MRKHWKQRICFGKDNHTGARRHLVFSNMEYVYFVSLGCDKNRVDSEYMLGLLAEQGFPLTDDPADAAVIIVNTCCFIGDAKEESIETILELAEQKETGRCRALIVTGCLSERYRDEVLAEMPEVDAILGTNSYDGIVSVIKEVLQGEKQRLFKPLTGFPAHGTLRVNTTGGYYAYLKIAEGCNKRCTYCVIPSVRGDFRSVPIEELVAEAKQLIASGASELILVAQESCSYGTDLYGEKSLHVLLDALNALPGLRWIRILYCYPEEIYDGLIEAIKRDEKVCHYLDMPIQHASDEVLRRMGRRTTKAELLARIELLRREIPDIALRTTLLTGFPGETASQHEELKDFVRTVGFDRLGVFPYSAEEGTVAADMPDQIADAVKEQRRAELMELSEELIFEKNEALCSRVFPVIVEGRLPEENVYVARTYRDAPEIDGYLFFPYDGELISGSFVTVEVTAANGYDLIGRYLPEKTEENNYESTQ